MSAPESTSEEARRILALLPPLRQWITTRVQQAGRANDLSMRQYAALHGIRDGATSPGELARLWQVTPAVITGIVDRLERRGLVRREPDPDDRRRLRLALTEKGLAANDAVEQALTADLAAQLAKVPAAQRAELSRSLDLLHRTFAAADGHCPLPAPLNADDDMPGWNDDDEAARMSPSESAPAASRDLVSAAR